MGRRPGKKWESRFPAFSRGFAWGIGLHGTGEAGAPRKREGDETSPAGVFRLFSVFGLANPAQVRFLRFPYQQITATTEAIDDPQSRSFDRLVAKTVVFATTVAKQCR